MAKLPKTAVGKIFKPDLRRMAIARVYDAALAEAGIAARVSEVIKDKKLASSRGSSGLARWTIRSSTTCFGQFTRPWNWKS